MSEANGSVSQGGSQNPWKWATIGLGGLAAVGLLVGIVKASFEKSDSASTEIAAVSAADATGTANESEGTATKAAAKPAAAVEQKPAPVRVATAAPSAPVAVAAARPTEHDIAACNSYAASTRTQTQDVVKKGVIGGALGAGVGAASGAIADGGKGAGKGAGIGAIVGATAGTVYGLNQKSQDDARAEQAYQQCMAQRGF